MVPLRDDFVAFLLAGLKMRPHPASGDAIAYEAAPPYYKMVLWSLLDKGGSGVVEGCNYGPLGSYPPLYVSKDELG